MQDNTEIEYTQYKWLQYTHWRILLKPFRCSEANDKQEYIQLCNLNSVWVISFVVQYIVKTYKQ